MIHGSVREDRTQLAFTMATATFAAPQLPRRNSDQMPRSETPRIVHSNSMTGGVGMTAYPMQVNTPRTRTSMGQTPAMTPSPALVRTVSGQQTHVVQVPSNTQGQVLARQFSGRIPQISSQAPSVPSPFVAPRQIMANNNNGNLPLFTSFSANALPTYSVKADSAGSALLDTTSSTSAPESVVRSASNDEEYVQPFYTGKDEELQNNSPSVINALSESQSPYLGDPQVRTPYFGEEQDSSNEPSGIVGATKKKAEELTISGLAIVDATRKNAEELGRSTVEFAKKPQTQVTAASAAAGGVICGTGGGVVGLTTGGIAGAIVGIVPAIFTFGLSIPIGAAIGGGAGLCVGSTVGGTAGTIGGGAVGYTAYRRINP